MNEKGEVGEGETRTHIDSKEEKLGIGILDTFRDERYSTARPPPIPVVRGEWWREKFGGVMLLRTEGKVSVESQVSERASKSRL